jgi:hypothetical protein
MEKINIKEILEREGEVRKFVGVSPEGFVLIHEKTLEDLKDFDIWKEWKNGNLKLQDLDKKNFE